MHLDQLAYFIEAARTKSITVASENLHVTHQAVSMAIKNLETELGLSLLNRTNQGVSLTPAGQYVVTEAANILLARARIQQYAQQQTQSTQPLTGEVQILCAPLFSMSVMSEVISEYIQAYPQVIVQLNEASSPDCYRQTKKDKYDIIIYNPDQIQYEERLQQTDSAYAPILLTEDQLVAMVNNHSKLSRKKNLTQKDLLMEHLVFHLDTNNQSWILQALLKDQQPKSIFYAENMQHFFEAVIRNQYVGFIARKLAKRCYYFDVTQLSLVPLQQKVPMYYVMDVKRSRQMDPAITALIAQIQQKI